MIKIDKIIMIIALAMVLSIQHARSSELLEQEGKRFLIINTQHNEIQQRPEEHRGGQKDPQTLRSREAPHAQDSMDPLTNRAVRPDNPIVSCLW